MKKFIEKIKQIPGLRWMYHLSLSWLAALWYGFPSRKVFVIGVTGTKGKSTVCELLAHILETAHKKVAVSSSVRNGESAMTMLGRFFLQRLVRRAVRDGCHYAIIEVTSQGVVQNRHRFIDWNVAVFTNLAPEHIESHGSLEKYREAKLRFFKYLAHRKTTGLAMSKRLKHFFINKDDVNAQYFIDAALGGEVVLYGKSELSTRMVGEFNKYNIGAAVAVAERLGISAGVIAAAVADFAGVPGRMEFVQREPFAVVVDYAHTPDSLRKVYATLKRLATSGQRPGRLVCVLGAAGGGRDTWKRPEMGKIAAEYCDEIILTNEDPYDEMPEAIIDEIVSGISQIRNPKSEILKIINRGMAIAKAILLATPGDVVVITGKGSERWMHLAGGKKIHWSDKDEVLSHFLTII